MEFGKLNKRVTIINRGTLTPDGIGGFTEGTPTMQTIWGSFRQLSNSEALRDGMELGEATAEVIVRRPAPNLINQSSLINIMGITFRIISLVGVGENYLTITATTKTD